MARYEGPLQAEREATAIDLRLLLETTGPSGSRSVTDRQEAIVCLLSASDGWRDACSRAGGAFADEPRAGTGLKNVKGE